MILRSRAMPLLDCVLPSRLSMSLAFHLRRPARIAIALTATVVGLVACGGESAPRNNGVSNPSGGSTTPTDPSPTNPVVTPTSLTSLGVGAVPERYTAEVWVRGTTAYTTTWGLRAQARGNAVKIWDVTSNTPRLVDSVIVANASTTGDVQVSDDGKLMLVAIESNPNGGVAIYDMADARKPQLITRTTGGELQYGVHTAELARVNGVLYAFCAIDPANGVPARLVVLDLTNPASPRTVWSQQLGAPYIHDLFVRDGYLFTAEWNNGVGIWDIGATSAGTVAAPRKISQATTVGGQVHNIWWLHDPSNGMKRFLLVGQEGPGSIGSASTGDVHVVDIADMRAPREVAVYNVPGAGTHNFSVDEGAGFAYAAYYNGGVRVLDVRGDLAACTVAQMTADRRCDMRLMGREKATFVSNPTYIWGVHWSTSGMFASDMLNGLWRLPAVTR